jgi:hypothetical protein
MKVFLAATLATVSMSATGILCVIAGTHGPDVLTYVGAFLLLPAVGLSRLGMSLGMPGLNRLGILSTITFTVVQLAYYYGMIRLAVHLRSQRQPPR